MDFIRHAAIFMLCLVAIDFSVLPVQKQQQQPPISFNRDAFGGVWVLAGNWTQATRFTTEPKSILLLCIIHAGSIHFIWLH